ncbi:MAG TPA: PhzF family phenazine biosynthesis protein [Vicinamibacterales bacterium]|nr:PhzF family phenazine biosynthesis protein [Vicinamibacterales bacterium]
MPLAYLHYDVFTGEPLLGNQLAVFTDARGLDTARMQRLAREMNFAESTFILPPEQPGTDIRMRIFTPMNEMPMAGHPTIGSTFALAHTGVITPGSSRFVFGLNIGPIPVDLEWKGSALRFAWMTQLNPTFGSPVADRGAVAAALGLEARDLVADLPVQEVSCGIPLLFVPLRDRATVDRAVSDAAAFRRLMASLRLEVPIFLFSIDPPGSGETAYSRMFAPEFGITEDPATGGASGPLGCYFVRHGIVRGEAARRMVSLQGVAMGRASRIHISITHEGDAISLVKVGGEAVLVARGEILV